MKICFSNSLLTVAHERNHLFPPPPRPIFFSRILSQKFVGKTGASIFNRFVLIHCERGSPPLHPPLPRAQRVLTFSNSRRRNDDCDPRRSVR